MIRPIVLVALTLLAARGATAQGFDAETERRFAEALKAVNLAPADLGWDKRPIDDDFRLTAVNRALDEPLSLATFATRAETDFKGDPLAAARAAASWLDVVVAGELVDMKSSSVDFADAPESAKPLLQLLVRTRRGARALHAAALGGLTAAERSLLASAGAKLYTDESEEPWDTAPVLTAAKKVDIGALVSAAAILADTARVVRESAASVDTSGWTGMQWTVDGEKVALGGPGDDEHDGSIVLDVGGDDLYPGGTMLVDLAGDDTYRDAASGLLAVALVLDLAGDDRHLGGNLVQAGAAFGVSLLIDVQGNDRYEADQCAQGAGFFGVGLLFDLAGDDAYRGARFVQGFAGVRGLGALSDLSGNDTYYAGGKYPHVPLLPENYQSLSQGFGFGMRPDASGGVGILADHAGNDIYSAEVFGQGASYWYALGILVDSGGHDMYNLYQYGQGAGIHLSSGVLFDRAGNDAYSCLNGVAQGSGHDWGTGLLWDGAGNDGYQGSGMSQGGANANAIGMLVDGAGNDSYAGWNVKNQGDSFFARGTLGLGVLLDLAGKDLYTHGGKDGVLWTRGTVGVGLDVADKVAP